MWCTYWTMLSLAIIFSHVYSWFWCTHTCLGHCHSLAYNGSARQRVGLTIELRDIRSSLSLTTLCLWWVDFSIHKYYIDWVQRKWTRFIFSHSAMTLQMNDVVFSSLYFNSLFLLLSALCFFLLLLLLVSLYKRNPYVDEIWIQRWVELSDSHRHIKSPHSYWSRKWN